MIESYKITTLNIFDTPEHISLFPLAEYLVLFYDMVSPCFKKDDVALFQER